MVPLKANHDFVSVTGGLAKGKCCIKSRFFWPQAFCNYFTVSSANLPSCPIPPVSPPTLWFKVL